MLPVLEGIIARRVLLNFRVDPGVAIALVPAPLEPAIQGGFAVAGVCLIRLERLRPKGLPSATGVTSENIAHRIAIRHPTPSGERDGVFIWRRDTDRALVALLGGRLFPGVHGKARFTVEESSDHLAYKVATPGGRADVSLEVRSVDAWPGSPLFPQFDDVREFFQRGDCGYSCSLRGDRLEGVQLRTRTWDMSPLLVEEVDATFYSDPDRFPKGSVELDGAVLMRGIPHEWHEISDVPEMAAETGGPS